MEQSESENRLLFLQASIGKELTNSPSNYMNWLRPVIISAQPGELVFSYVVRKEMTNPYHTLHGGVIAGIMDDIIGATVYTLGLKSQFTTVNNSIDYFSPAKEGDLIIAKTAIVKRGRTIINLSCELTLPAKDRLLAKGYSSMLNIG